LLIADLVANQKLQIQNQKSKTANPKSLPDGCRLSERLIGVE
jgi:hypothetical protein